MKTWMTLLMLSGALAMQAVPAAAFDGIGFSMQGQGSGGGRGGHGGRNAHPPREARVVQPPPVQQAPRGRGQMTDDERRQLHRDLDKANREIYRGRR